MALAAPSSPVPASVLEKSVRSIRFLGLEPVVMPGCKMVHGYLSGPDAQRAQDLNRAFADPSIKGIFCLRGGFGASRILPLLDFSMISANPKVFVGYSDITALHLAFNKLCGFLTFHAPMPNTSYSRLDSYSLSSLRQNLFSSEPAGIVKNPPGESLEVIVPGTASGEVTGGNLSLIQGTLGSPYEIDTRGKILFLEDVGERPYRLDKALTALSLAGKFRDCCGILLGTFTECEEPDETSVPAGTKISDSTLSIRQIIKEVIEPWKKPALFNFRAGHIFPQATIPLGEELFFDTASSAVRFG